MNKFIMMIGLPASGKSTYAQELAEKENAIIHSSDTLREEIYEDINDNKHNGELFQELHKRIKQDLLQNKNVIYDATNINYKKRKAFLEEIKKINCTKECYFIATPYERCLQLNNQRERKVPEYAITRMYKSIYIPQYYEGWDKINIIRNSGDMEFNISDLFNGADGLNKISQDNPHHTLTIGQHCIKCSQICNETSSDNNLFVAGLLHDIGKRFTKQFKNSKGEDTDIAHYYSHHLVSAYDSLFFFDNVMSQDRFLNIIGYITWHMQPFFITTDKAKDKFIKLVGQEFYDNLIILHQADIMAK